jgi:outer membrane lipoprotein-sorting protein
MKNKKIIFIIFAIIILIIVSIFLICHYKNTKNGNTIINKSEEEILNSILEMKSYNATLSITIETNKNKTQYKVKQTLENGKATQEVLEPENIAGVTTEYDGTNLKITNNKLNLETTFQNYQYMVENRLWLDSFIEEFNKNENTQITSEENEIILEVKNKDNPYNVHKKLYIDKKTGKPTKMIVKDINQKTLVYILYTEIEIS